MKVITTIDEVEHVLMWLIKWFLQTDWSGIITILWSQCSYCMDIKWQGIHSS